MARKISEIMTKRLLTVEPETTLVDAAQVMKEKSIRHLLVIDRSTGGLLGIISDRDIKKFVSPFVGSARETPQDKATASIEVGKVMIPKDKVSTSKIDDDIKSVLEKMMAKKLGTIPIVDDKNRVVGIVTRSDMLRQLVSLL